MPRPLRERLEFDLDRNRRELLEVVAPIEDFNYAPTPNMKSYRAQLVEIGATEAETIAVLRIEAVPEWKTLESGVRQGSLAELLESLASIRRELLDCLQALSEDELREAVAVPAEWAPSVPTEWAPFGGNTTLEREELFRWLARHEYYHLGQIIAYRWIQGFDPYH